ncbi:MAG: RnfABCDGE type electron transport complex subunit D [Gammaproteobacteria bacterium]|nr:RnfABCDGE type electron transport complex subunit D [Gammaproteobacteria bacterium]
MKQKDPQLVIRPSPFLKPKLTTPLAMLDVIYALIPVTLASLWFFGLSALLVMLTCIAGAMLTEWTFAPAGENRAESLKDGSAFLTGLLLGFTLPPALPLWIAFIGGVAAIGLGKTVWGGLGQNLFNPALVGRAFLLATFPIGMTTWTAFHTGPAHFFEVQMSNFTMPFMQVSPQVMADAVTAATPLGLMKFEYQGTPLTELIMGNIPGSFGETSGLLIILGGIFLIWRRSIDWRIPAAILLATAIFSGILFMVDSGRYPDPLFSIFSGGLLFGAIFMATDPVTSPLSPKGVWIFGAGIGLLVVLIRVYGGFPEGVMYAILLMNACAPLIERYTQPLVFGRKKS